MLKFLRNSFLWIIVISRMETQIVCFSCHLKFYISTIHLSINLTLTFILEKKRLKYRDIRNDKIQFDFIRLEWAITNDWEDLFTHRRILGAIGIADCKQWDNILLAGEEFSR